MNFKLLIVVLVSVFYTAGCCTFASSPSSVVKHYVNHLVAGKSDEAVNLLSKNYVKNYSGGIERIKKDIMDQAWQGKEMKKRLKSYDIEKEEILGDEARVTGKVIFTDETVSAFTCKLVRESCSWKIDSIDSNN